MALVANPAIIWTALVYLALALFLLEAAARRL